MQILGRSEHTLDNKNRLHLPRRVLSKFTETERQSLTLARSLDKCLCLYTPQAWAAYTSQFQGPAVQLDDEQRKFFRWLLQVAFEVAVDGQGRILIPEHLKKVAEIKNSVIVGGGVDAVEIWALEVWQDYFGVIEQVDSFDQVNKEIMAANYERTSSEKQQKQQKQQANLGGPV